MDKKTIMRKAIADALEQQLQQVDSLQELSVQQILAACGLSRPTFYRYFSDKYDVVNWIYTYYVEELAPRDPPLTHEQRVLRMVQFFYEKQSFFRKTMDYNGQNSFNEYFFANAVRFATAHYSAQNGGAPLPIEDTYTVIHNAAGMLQVIREWLFRGCRETPECLCAVLMRNTPPELRELS